MTPDPMESSDRDIETLELHLDPDCGLWIPLTLRDFDSQIVIRTPRTTIQHFGSNALPAYYPMVDASHFGDVDEFCDPKNPDLAPDRVRLKPQGEDAVTFPVERDPPLGPDGGAEATKTTRKQCPYKECGWQGAPYDPDDTASTIVAEEDAIVHWETEHGGKIPETATFGDHQCPECYAGHGLHETASCSECGYIPESVRAENRRSDRSHTTDSQQDCNGADSGDGA
jgi:hypothetical protein